MTHIFIGHIYYKTVSNPPEPELGEQPQLTRRATDVTSLSIRDYYEGEIPEEFFLEGHLPPVMRRVPG